MPIKYEAYGSKTFPIIGYGLYPDQQLRMFIINNHQINRLKQTFD